MANVRAYVLYGNGLGCHKEVAHAYEKAGAQVEIIHINKLKSGDVRLDGVQILNIPGGFLQGDILGAGMAEANEIEHAVVDGKRLKDTFIDFAARGNLIYGQCNGFQLLVKLGLLPGIGNDYSKQTVTLTNNRYTGYYVAPTFHKVESDELNGKLTGKHASRHFAFDNIDPKDLWLPCRHGEGRLLFYSPSGSISKEQAHANRIDVNQSHVLLLYANPATGAPAIDFPYNPNGSDDAIAGLRNLEGTIIGHMAHTEAVVHLSRDQRFWKWKDDLRRCGVKSSEIDDKRMHAVGLKVFKNIVGHF